MNARQIRTLPEAEVLRRWADLYAAGKQKGYAPPNPEPYLGRDATWVEVDPFLSPKQQERAERYARTPGALPPGMAGYKGARAKRRLGTLYVSDGNHRAYAAFLPQNEWRLFQEVQQEA